MEQATQNKMAVEPMKRLFWKMGLPMIVSMVLQALGYAVKPLVLAFLRLILFTFPVAFLFTLSENVLALVWWTFPIAEILTCVFSYLFLRRAVKKIAAMESGDKLNKKKEIRSVKVEFLFFAQKRLIKFCKCAILNLRNKTKYFLSE